MGRKPKRARRAPAIVPRFLKSVVTVGAIPSLAAACHKTATRTQPVVAAYSQPQPPPPVVAAYALDAGPTPPPPPIVVVAAYVPKPPIRPDAAVDAPPPSALGPNPRDTFNPPPAVVAAYVPRDVAPEPEQPKTKPKQKKKP